ncbi:Rv3235 family protein [Tessaracoccus coleopterorum]|uniref:Rv3235 family protein n=1 Tax=Tessaracoccus coleopterorum TaxID=2714950 RepID=UPI002F90DD07
MAGLRTQMPTLRAVEASVRLAEASRWLTCVIRLDAAESFWRCTDLYVLLPNRR